MPFASINPTTLRIGDFEKRPFWKSAILDFFFQRKIFFCLIPMKISHKLCDRMNRTQFWCFPLFPANSLLCVIIPYTVYKIFTLKHSAEVSLLSSLQNDKIVRCVSRIKFLNLKIRNWLTSLLIKVGFTLFCNVSFICVVIVARCMFVKS